MSASKWIKFPSKTENPRLRLFCFPYAGGVASLFRRWQAHFPSDIQLCPIEYPGHGTRQKEPPSKRVSALVSEVVEDLKGELNQPYALYGHSLGSIIAFELARAIRDNRLPAPKHLLVSGRHAPQAPLPHDTMYTLPDNELIETVMDKYGGIPEAVLQEPELLALMLPTLRADLEMYENYQYQTADPLPYPLSCFGGDDDKMHPTELLEPWREQTKAECEIKVFSGSHFFIQDQQNEFLKALLGRLAVN